MVIGGGGFIGRYLVKDLSDQGYRLRVMDTSHLNFNHANIHFIEGDYGDTKLLQGTLKGVNTVIHLASSTYPANSMTNITEDIENNLQKTIKLLNVMVDRRVRKIIFLSSGGTVYGNPSQIPVDEESTTFPISSYGAVKLTIEKYLFMYTHLYGIESLILRPSNLYGCNRGKLGVHGVISTFLNQLKSEACIDVYGDGTAVRDYLYIKDFVELFSLMLEKDLKGIYNVGSGKGHSINDIVDIIKKVTGKELCVNYLAKRLFDVNNIVLDVRKLQESINWEPAYSIEQGIMEVWNTLKND